MSVETIWPDTACVCFDPRDEIVCVCGDAERYLRAGIVGGVALSPEQRTWCLNEIANVEGWDPAEHVSDSDQDLARNVLSAWTDYCRDKGLL